MSPRPTHRLGPDHFVLLDRIVQRLADGEVDETTRRAVTALTTAADPARADRLAVRPGEPAPLVERLAVWALRRADAEAMRAAHQLLDGTSQDPVDTPAGRGVEAPVPC